MALMFAQCPQVTTMGDRTAGSSGNPRMVETKGKINVRLPRWDDRDPQKNPIEGKGVAPKIAVAAKPEQFTDKDDPVFEQALAKLREIPEDERKAGKREDGKK
jgi:C-terminal processing protease CtpA/Prc